MTRSETHIARYLTGLIAGAACKGRGTWWSQQEAAHAAATTPETAAAEAAPALDLCKRCTQVDLCRQRAEIDHYTGLAAGAVFLNGRQLPVTTVMPQPLPARAAS